MSIFPSRSLKATRSLFPIAVYNYSGKRGQVSLKLKPENWFSLDHDTPDKSVAAESGRVGASQFTLTATRIGKFKLTLSAHMEGSVSSR